MEVVQTVLAAGAMIRAQDENGKRALHLAAKFGRHEAVQVLLARGAKIEARDRSGKTALHFAAGGRSKGPITVNILLLLGAEVHVTDQNRMTALHFAVVGRNLGIVRQLLALGADPQARDLGGRIPMEVAAAIDWEIMDLLRKHNQSHIKRVRYWDGGIY